MGIEGLDLIAPFPPILEGEIVTPIVEKIRGGIEIASVKNVDETGVKINGKINWWHVVSTEEMTWYRLSEKRKDKKKDRS